MTAQPLAFKSTEIWHPLSACRDRSSCLERHGSELGAEQLRNSARPALGKPHPTLTQTRISRSGLEPIHNPAKLVSQASPSPTVRAPLEERIAQVPSGDWEKRTRASALRSRNKILAMPGTGRVRTASVRRVAQLCAAGRSPDRVSWEWQVGACMRGTKTPQSGPQPGMCHLPHCGRANRMDGGNGQVPGSFLNSPLRSSDLESCAVALPRVVN